MRVELSPDEQRQLRERNAETLARLADYDYHLGGVARERTRVVLLFWRGSGGDREVPDAEVAEGEMEIWLRELDAAVKPKQLRLL